MKNNLEFGNLVQYLNNTDLMWFYQTGQIRTIYLSQFAT